MAKNWKKAHDIVANALANERERGAYLESQLSNERAARKRLGADLRLAVGHMFAAADQFLARKVDSTAMLLRGEAARLDPDRPATAAAERD